MLNKFITHGYLNVFVEDRILFVTAKYSPNSEMVREFEIKTEEHIEALREAPWGSIAYLEDDSIFPLDAIAMIEANLARMISLGLVGIAVIIRNAESPSVIRDFWQSIYEKQEVPYHFFDNEEDAKAWLLRKISLTSKA